MADPGVLFGVQSGAGTGVPGGVGGPGALFGVGATGGGQAGAPAAGKIPVAKGANLKTKKKGGGGLFGHLRGAAHFVADKAERAGHDLKAIPVGIAQSSYDTVRAVATPVSPHQVLEEWEHPLRDVGGRNTAVMHEVVGQVKGAKTAVEHPLRDPFMTALTVAPLAHGLGKAADIGIAAKTGESITAKPRFIKQGERQTSLHGSTNPTARLIQAGYDKVVQHGLDTNPEGRIAKHGEKRIHGSLAETQRYKQHLREVPANEIDNAGAKLGGKTVLRNVRGKGGFSDRKIQQRALRMTSEQFTPEEGIHFHTSQAESGVSRKSNLRMAKLDTAVKEAGIVRLNPEGKVEINAEQYPHLAKLDSKIEAGQHEVDRIALRHHQMTAEGIQTRVDAPNKRRAGKTEESMAAHSSQMDLIRRNHEEQSHRIDVAENALNRRAASQSVKREAAITKANQPGAYERASNSAAMAASVVREQLRSVDEQIAKVRATHAKASEYQGQMMEHGFETRAAGERAFKPLDQQQEHVAKLQDQYEQLHAKRAQLADRLAELAPAAGQQGEFAAQRAESVQQLAGAQGEQAAGLAQKQEEMAAARQAHPGQLFGALKAHPEPGADARPGRNYVSDRNSEPDKSGGQIRATQGPVVGKPRKFIKAGVWKAKNLEEGTTPDNTTHLVAENMRSAYRFANTDEWRRTILETGSDHKRSNRDVLVAEPGEAQAKLTKADKQAVGKEKDTSETVGEMAGLQAYLDEIVPGRKSGFAEEKSQDPGTEAPKGYKWVSKSVLGDLAKPIPGERGALGKGVSELNAAVTAATVYLKVGHVGTRVLTNAATQILQGAANPLALKRGVQLWQQLSHTDRQRAMAAAGQKGFEALPAEGSGPAARVARSGAKWWAQHADAAFRFASIAYEADKAGFRTPEAFRGMLDTLENPHGKDAATVAKADWVAKRADRAAIAYDRLNSFEKGKVSRVVWFYPWIKGSTVFTGHTIVEHPYKSAVLGGQAQQGVQNQQKRLGDIPFYEGGELPLGHGQNPMVSDLSTFSPFATAADVVRAGTHPKDLVGFANPAMGAGVHFAQGQDQYGQSTNTPVTSALGEIVSPAPEAQILTNLFHQHEDQSNRQFHATALSALLRSLGGPATPRHQNLRAAHKAYGREVSNR